MITAVVALATVGLDAPAATPRLPAAPSLLAGSTVLQASSTASTRVRIPRTATLTVRADQRGTIQLGRGRAYGFVLSRSNATTAGQVLAVARLNRCHVRACAAPNPEHTFEINHGVGFPVTTEGLVRTYTIPAGDYDLTVFTDGAPTTIRLTLGNLTGSTAIRASSAARSVVAQAPTESSNGTSPYYAPPVVGAEQTTDTTILAASLAYDMAVRSDSPSGLCLYADRIPALGRATPGCFGGASGPISAIGGLRTNFQGWTVSLYVLQKPAGRWNAGHYLVGGGTPPRGASDFTFVDVPST